MRFVSAAGLLMVLCGSLVAQSPRDLTGKWVVTEQFLGTQRYVRLELAQKGTAVSGSYRGFKLAGTAAGEHVTMTGKNDDGDLGSLEATVTPGTMLGTMTYAGKSGDKVVATIKAEAFVGLKRGVPQRHEFVPTVFYRQFSPFYEPVLRVAPGDTIHTTTVDAGGTDEHGKRRSAGGNPETGPFYVEGAMPGDTLVVHIDKLRLNRDWAESDDSIVMTASGPELAVLTKDNNRSIKWHLDLAKQTGTPDEATGHLKKFAVPLHPMLGCVATATGPGNAPPPTTDSGFFGGNMDFNEISDGATIYLPVNNPGALLYFGDGHAVQGDGELNGNALETSMDVEITVDVIQGKRIGGPRIETAEQIMTGGLMGSLDDALREATGDMARWLTDEYKLTPSEVGQVMGVGAQYRISEVADRNSGVVLKMNKALLGTLIEDK